MPINCAEFLHNATYRNALGVARRQITVLMLHVNNPFSGNKLGCMKGGGGLGDIRGDRIAVLRNVEYNIWILETLK